MINLCSTNFLNNDVKLQLVFAPTFLAFFLGSMTLWTTQSVELTQQKITQVFSNVVAYLFLPVDIALQ